MIIEDKYFRAETHQELGALIGWDCDELTPNFSNELEWIEITLVEVDSEMDLTRFRFKLPTCDNLKVGDVVRATYGKRSDIARIDDLELAIADFNDAKLMSNINVELLITRDSWVPLTGLSNV
jgi:hypothetical protein